VEREMFEVTCSNCGNLARVPFQPRGDRPVYCRDCFERVGGGGGRTSYNR
jgi:CxxC-x17-CxxC domain-containing protein